MISSRISQPGRRARRRHHISSAIVSAASFVAVMAAAPVLAQPSQSELRWGVVVETTTLDPAFAFDTWGFSASYNLYDTLVWQGEDGAIVPKIAESWEVSEDGLTYTFKIQPGILFHDGSELDAEDVVFSLNRMMEMRSPISAYFGAVDSEKTKVIDNYTVSISLKKPYSPFLRSLLAFQIINKDLVMANLAPGEYGEFKDYGAQFFRSSDAGSGPYTATKFATGDGLVLEMFDKYTLSEIAPDAPKKVTISTIPEMATIATKLRAGEIDIADWALPISVQKSLANDSNFAVRDIVSPGSWFVLMNNAKPPLDDPYVRRAIALAYDRETVTKHILGFGGPLAGPVPPYLLGNCNDIITYDFDLEKAKEMLSKSKYSADELAKLPITLAAVSSSERFKNIALMLITNMKKIGLPADIAAVRYADITQAATTKESAYHMAVFTDTAKVPDPSVFLTYFTKEGWGRSFPPGGLYYENAKVTELVDKAVQSNDPAIQQSSYCEASKLIAEDSPAIFSHTNVWMTSSWAYVNRIFGGNESATYLDMRFEKWGVDTSDPKYVANHP